MNTTYSLALDFHENTKSIRVSQFYDPKTQYKIYPSAKAIPLEKNDLNAARESGDSFLKAILERKSTREFSSDNISLETLSKLLTLSFGIRKDGDKPASRTYASAGGRFPVEVYVAIFRSDEMERGIYHYNVIDNTLEFIKPGDCLDELYDFYQNQKDAITTDYPCLILFSMVFNRTMQKYGERGYRLILLDAGHMGQNLYLTAAYLNLGVVALGAGAGNDNKLDDILGLVHAEENVFYGFAAGIPARTPE